MGASEKSGHNRNYWAMAVEGSFFMAGIALLSTSGTVALFLDSMTGSKALVGLAATVATLSMLLGQLSIAPYIRTIRKLPGFLFKHMIFQRTIPLLMALPLFIGIAGNWPVGIFLALFGIFWFYDGFLTVPWGELSARALKPELRSHMMGMQVTIGGIASLLTGLLLTWLLATPSLSDNYRFAVIFVLAGLILLPSVLAIRLVNDPSPIENPEKLHIRQYYARIPAIIKREKLLQHALIARLPAFIGFSSVTFIVVFGASTLDLSDVQVSWLVYANIVGGLVGGISLGEISRRFGNKVTIMFCNAGVFIALGMAVSLVFFPSLGYVWLFATCALASLTMSNWIGYFNYFLDIAPREERSVFQVIGTCIGIPFSFVGYALGMIIDSRGFVAAFTIGGVSAVAAFILSIRLKSKSYIQTMQKPD
ncbi:MAG: hypothetical protein FWE91_08780 [Defluviitaleaceae bacterium]|nr:hypothetical protein [Defluviitaleaceae bacterium]MCL2836026.1 hypothetical protein [Defluviitaleaceae bacterium]